MKITLFDVLMAVLHFIQRYWQWGIRLALLWIAAGAIMPPPPRAILDEPQRVETTKPLMCVHTRFTDEVQEWIIQRSMRLVREMGADTIIEFFPWAYYEPARDVYQWQRPDMVMRHAENQGLKVIARMGFVPEWARRTEDGQPTTESYLPESSFVDFAEFVAEFAARYGDILAGVIIWNEPNLSFEWGFRQVDAAGYTDMLKVVYESVKAVRPDLTILAGALAPTLEPVNSASGLNDLIYLEQMYQAGAADYFDALAIHTYGFTESAEADSDPDSLNFRRAELLHQVMLRYDRVDKPVYITESGWNDHPRWTKAVRPSQRIQYTIDGYRYAEEHWDWLDKLCLWAFRYPRFTYSYPDNFMIIPVGFELSPLYYALQAYARGQELDKQLWLSPPVDTGR